MNSESHPSFYKNWWIGKLYWCSIGLWFLTILVLLSGISFFFAVIVAVVAIVCIYIDGKLTLQRATHCPNCFMAGELNEYNPISNELHLDCDNCGVSWNLEMPKNFFRNSDSGGGDSGGCD